MDIFNSNNEENNQNEDEKDNYQDNKYYQALVKKFGKEKVIVATGPLTSKELAENIKIKTQD